MIKNMILKILINIIRYLLIKNNNTVRIINRIF